MPDIDTEISYETSSEAPDISPRKALFVSTAGYAMDGFDLLILGFMLPAISKTLGLNSVQGASLVTATLLGAVAGGIFFGILSDHVGRVKVLTWTILLFAVFTGLCAISTGYWDLLAYRTVAGMGLGGEFGIGMALVGEAWPADYRARASSFVALGWQAGALIASISTPLLLPVIGWRGMFAIGFIPSLASFILRRNVGETRFFQERKHNMPLKESLYALIENKRAVKSSIAMIVLCSVQNFGYYGLMVWLPRYLSETMGYSYNKSALWVVFTVLGTCFGTLIFGQLADRIGRRWAFFLFQAGAAIMVYEYSQFRSPTELLVGGVVMGIFINGMMGGYGALISELFPTSARATAQNFLFNVGRGIGGLGPLVMGAVAMHYSFSIAISLLTFIYIIDIIVTAILIPETKGALLE